jgi:L-methionine (R)-S-oxide reductase
MSFEKAAAYDDVFREIAAILEHEGTSHLDDIAMMATVNSVLTHKFPYFYWTGFYRLCGDVLIVGPYVGTVGCLEIAMGKGVCGTAAQRRETLVVPDVRAFPGHIACDAASRSEIVVPVFASDGNLIAVLDIDSDQTDAFDAADQAGLERICQLFSR